MSVLHPFLWFMLAHSMDILQFVYPFLSNYELSVCDYELSICLFAFVFSFLEYIPRNRIAPFHNLIVR